jgi:DNA-binding NtrC family response regulator
MARILIVDDESNMRRILSVLLREDGHDIVEAATVREAEARMETLPLDLVLTDQRLPDGEGLGVLAVAGRIDRDLPVIVLTAYASVELAVEAMRRGAFDFVTKPFQPEVVRAAVRRGCERVDLLRENQRLRTEVRRLGTRGAILGESSAMRAVRETIDRVAPTSATVLITGETGTGKELVARAIHQRSLVADGTFVAVNCAALPETLLESELFGHERGAFTGAERSRPGLFETAHRGTLLLDEAGEMSAPLQAKLLRVLNDGQIVRVGSNTPRKVDVRLVAATHRDLPERVREGSFREDLYYRIAVVPLPIPPLRDRAGDLPLLVETFLTETAHDLKLPRKSITREALARLAGYPFPGNVRELRNLIERAYILSRGETFGPEDFPVGGNASPVAMAAPMAPTELRPALDRFERDLLSQALSAARGVQAEAARLLGISRSDLSYKIRKHGIVRES